MNVKQERLDLREDVFKTEPDLGSGQTLSSASEQKCENEQDDVFEEFGINTREPEQNVDDIKQEIIECEELTMEQRSDLLSKVNYNSVREKYIQFSPTIIKKEFENTGEIKAGDIDDIKEDISEYDQSKSELLTAYCDLPTLKNENIEYTNCLAELSDREQNKGISKPLKNNANVVLNMYITQKYFPSISKSNNLNEDCQELLVVCKFCGKFMKKNYLQKHLMIHVNQKPLKCSIGSKTFKEKCVFKTEQDLVSEHAEIMTTYCDLPTLKNDDTEYPDCLAECGNSKPEERKRKYFPTSNSRSNQDGNFGNRFVDCEQFNLQAHLRTHTPEKPFKCDICSKGFTQESNLQRHLITNTNKKIFKCNICSKEFYSKYHFERHVIIHTDEKPFKCDICWKEFNQKSSWQQHLKIHSKDRAFKCEICSKGFNRKSTLQAHLKTHNNE